MKKIVCILTLALFAFGASVFAAGKGGFVDPAKGGGKGGFRAPAKITSVMDVHGLPDDTVVTLKGFIIEHIKGDNYRFRGDGEEDSVVVEIDDDEWKGQVVTPDDLVLIVGEVDIDRSRGYSMKVDAKSVTKVAAEAKRGKDAVAPVGCTNCGCPASQKK